MKYLLALLMIKWCLGVALAQAPLDPNLFQAGTYGDPDRTVTCVSGQPQDTFSLVVWAWVPDDLGLAYLTLRFEFPGNLELSNRPELNPLISELIITDYPANTVEWNLILTDCPSGWVQIFTQHCILLDDQPDQVRILAANSMVRDCGFVLNDLIVPNNLSLNDPGCEFISVTPTTWAGLKSLYR